MRLDPDMRFRSSYAPYASTGRLRSSANSHGTGGNAQNLDHQARDIYVPDIIPEGYPNAGTACVFLGLDMSQAEDRVTKVYTKSSRLIEIARLKPGEGTDPHTKAASIAFNKPMDQISKFPERYVGKRARHGGHYGMGGGKLSDELVKEGLFFTADECQEMMDRIINQDEPEVRDWQREIRKELFQNRSRLTNSWGRTISFEGERFDDQLYHKAYAYKPQSDVGILMTQWGLVPMDAAIQAGQFRPHYVAINQDGHDSLLISVDPVVAWDVLEFLKTSLEQPRLYDGVELVIWTEACLGSSFDMETDGVEFKKLPGRDAFIDVAKAKAKEVPL